MGVEDRRRDFVVARMEGLWRRGRALSRALLSQTNASSAENGYYTHKPCVIKWIAMGLLGSKWQPGQAVSGGWPACRLSG